VRLFYTENIFTKTTAIATLTYLFAPTDKHITRL
jgi:hypothetical protein